MARSVNRYLKHVRDRSGIPDAARAAGLSRFEGIGIYAALVYLAAVANDSFRFADDSGQALPPSIIAQVIGCTAKEQEQVVSFLQEGLQNGLFVKQGGFISLPRTSPSSWAGGYG